MDRERLITEILDIIRSEDCDICYAAGVECLFKPYSRIRIINFDHINQFSLSQDQYDCQIRRDPFLTEKDVHENAQTLRNLFFTSLL
jgi:hypothetical protein